MLQWFYLHAWNYWHWNVINSAKKRCKHMGKVQNSMNYDKLYIQHSYLWINSSSSLLQYVVIYIVNILNLKQHRVWILVEIFSKILNAFVPKIVVYVYDRHQILCSIGRNNLRSEKFNNNFFIILILTWEISNPFNI